MKIGQKFSMLPSKQCELFIKPVIFKWDGFNIQVAETDKMSYVGKNFGEVTANKAKGLCK